MSFIRQHELVFFARLHSRSRQDMKLCYLHCTKGLLLHTVPLFTVAVSFYFSSLKIIKICCLDKQCSSCNTRFYPNFYVHFDQKRGCYVQKYYDASIYGGCSIPKYIQTEQHTFMEAELCEFFANCMLLFWSVFLYI